MRRFKNEATKIVDGGNNNSPMRYSHIAILTMDAKAQKGTTRSEMSKDLELIKKLVGFAESEEVVLEDAEYDNLKSAEKNMVWTLNHEGIVAYGEALDNAEKFTSK